MKSVVCCALLLLLAGSAMAQRPRRALASPSPKPSPSPAPSSPSPAAGDNTTATADSEPAAGAANTTGGSKNIPDKRIKGFFDSPEAATKEIAELSELNKLIGASPAVSKLLKDKNLVATIFAPNNAAVKSALAYVQSSFPNVTTEQLSEMGIIDSLLQYHVTAGNAALTSDRLKDGMKLTMLNKEATTIVKKAADAAANTTDDAAANTTDTANTTTGGDRRRLLQADDALFIASNTNQTVAISDPNYQGGKAIIHIIDGVLIPESLVKNYSLTDIPGASNETTAGAANETAPAEEPAAAGANETTTEPAAGAEGNDTSKAGAAGTKGGAAAGAPAASPAPTTKSSAATAVATLLAVPTLLAVLLL